MKIYLIRLLGLISICFNIKFGTADKYINVKKSDEQNIKAVCYTENDVIYEEIFNNDIKKINIGSIYRLLPPGPINLLFYFEQSKVAAIESINVPLALGLHRPQNISTPINRSVASSTALIYLNEEFYINRFIEYTINTLGLPLQYTFLGTCILYSFRSFKNQMNIPSSLPDIYKIATMTLQLPSINHPEFKRICKQYMNVILSIPRYYSPLNMISELCSQIPICMEDTNLMNSVISIREILSNKPISNNPVDTSNRFTFIANLKKKYQGKSLNENILKLFRLTTKFDSILATYFTEKKLDIFGITDQNQIDSWHQIIEYIDDKNPDKITCEEALRLYLKAFPIFPKNFNKKKRDYLSNILCNSSEQAKNELFSPFSPSSISFQYLMYLNEYLELPIDLISKSQCVFFLSASYTGMFPRFEHSTELAVLLYQYDLKKKKEFISNCIKNLPKYINLSENTFVNKERIVINIQKDAMDICKAIFKCYQKYNLNDNDLNTLMLSVISYQGDYYNQLLPRSKFISKRVFNLSPEKKYNIKNSNLLSPKTVISEIIKTQDPNISIKTQKLYSTLLRLGLSLTDNIQISEYNKLKRPISFPKEVIETRNIEEVVPTISEISNIISNTIIPSNCADSIINKYPELNKVFNTILTICDYVLFNSYPNPFSEIPYLLKLVTIASDNYGFSFNQIKRIYAYSASSFLILGVQIKLYPLFLFIGRYSTNDQIKSEYNLCIENFQFGLFFTNSQIKDKETLFCKYASLVLEDKYFEKNILFALKTFSKKSIVEEDWNKSLSDLFKDIKITLINSIDFNLQTGLSIGDGTKYYPFFTSKLIRKIQKSNYFGELLEDDIKDIFLKIYQNFEFIPTIGSSSFIGNSLRYEFISAKNTSKDMNNSKFISDQLFGLRYIFSNEIKLEEFPYLVARCKYVLDEFFISKGINNILDLNEICKFTFSLPNKELPNQLSKNALFINYLVNYFSIPQQIIPQLYCINKVINVFTDISLGNHSFESSLNFGLNLYYLTRAFRNINESNFNEKCKVAALLSNIIDTNTDNIIYDENASIKTNHGLSLEKHIINPINYKYVNSFCTAIKQCSKPNVFNKYISDYILNQTLYNFIYQDHLSGDPLKSYSNNEEQKNLLKENKSKIQFKPKLENLISRLIIDGFEIYTQTNKKIKIKGLRILEAIRLFGVFHDSFNNLLNEPNISDQIINYSFTGLYSGNLPIIGGNDSIEKLSLFTLETAVKIVYEIAQEISFSESEITEFSHLILSNHELTIKICKEKLKLILPKEFNTHEIFSICVISFSPFKY